MKKLRIHYNGKIYEMGVEEINDEKGVVSLDNIQTQNNTPVPNKVKEVEPLLENTKNEEVEAPMPGRIVQIDVKVGQSVQSGDTLMVVEAMKLENEITCDTTGVVKEIKVQVGEMVDSGHIVAVIG